MKKIAILLLAAVAFCKELSVTDLNGNEIKFELKDTLCRDFASYIGATTTKQAVLVLFSPVIVVWRVVLRL